jgi:hypothetical protein
VNRSAPLIIAIVLVYLIAAPLALALPEKTSVTSHDPQGVPLGESVQGRVIDAYRFGSGPVHLALVGGLHGGYEGNTAQLVGAAVNYFTEHSDQVPSAVSLFLVPSANPDGLASGGRMNSRGVDLNRNWDYDWTPKAVWQNRTVGAGVGPFSEPETRALKGFLENGDFKAVIFYHSAAGNIVVGSCGSPLPAAQAIVRRLSSATGYPFREQGFDYYPVTGAAADYLACRNVPAIDLELSDHTHTEWDRNLRGILALMGWLAGVE